MNSTLLRRLLVLLTAFGLFSCSEPQKETTTLRKGEAMSNFERDKIIQIKLNSFGRESFPDDTDVTWLLRGAVHKGDYSFVEAEPSPATVGYSRVKFVLFFKQISEPILASCYYLDNGQWNLLFSNPEVPSDWKSLQ